MTEIFELAAFTVREGHERALLAERAAMIAAMRSALAVPCPNVISDIDACPASLVTALRPSLYSPRRNSPVQTMLPS